MAEAETQTEQPASDKKKLPIKTMAILAAVLLLEGLTVLGAYMFLGGPAEAHADGALADEIAAADELVEELVVADKFQNTKTGRAYLYDTEVYITVRRRHHSEVTGQLEQMSAQVSTDIATIFRRAEPSHLSEPTLATLTRQIKAALDERIGHDEEGRPLVEEVLIRRCVQFRTDI